MENVKEDRLITYNPSVDSLWLIIFMKEKMINVIGKLVLKLPKALKNWTEINNSKSMQIFYVFFSFFS